MKNEAPENSPETKKTYWEQKKRELESKPLN